MSRFDIEPPTGKVFGRSVPRLEDLYSRRVGLLGWAAWSGGVLLAALAALSQLDLLSHVAAAGLSVGVILFLSNAVRVGTHWRARSVEVKRSGLATSKVQS